MTSGCWRLIALAWLGFLDLWVANRGFSGLRALLLVGFAAAAAFMLNVRQSTRRAVLPRHAAGWAPLAALAAAHFALFEMSWFGAHPTFVDIGLTTLAAARAILHGLDPYTIPIDPQQIVALKGFDGYKYTPVMALAYLPLGAAFGTRGLLLTNLFADLGVALMIRRLGTRMGGPSAGLTAILLYLSLPVVPLQLFQVSVTDLVPVLLLLIGLTFHGRLPTLSGLFMGLSVAAKPFPGLIAAAYGLGERNRLRYLGGCAVGIIPVVVFVAHSGRALVDNTILFNFVRPPDSTAWLFGQTAVVVDFTRMAALTILLAGAAILWRRGDSLHARCCWTIVGVIASILAGAAAHTNYLLWWSPLFCAVLPVALQGLRTSPDVSNPEPVR